MRGDDGGHLFGGHCEKATSGSTWTVRLLSASPAPPDRGFNQFTLKLLDVGGQPVDGLTVTVEARMPQHGHGTIPAILGSTPSGDGGYSVPEDPDNTGLDLIMPGAWTVSFHVEDSAGKKETAEFVFCLEG